MINQSKIRLISITIGLLGGVAGYLAYAYLMTNQKQDLYQKFKTEASRDLLVLQGKLEVNEQNLARIGDLFVATGTVTPTAFRAFVAPIIRSYPFIQALEWVPKVPHSQRQVQRAGPERGAQGVVLQQSVRSCVCDKRHNLKRCTVASQREQTPH